MLQSVIITFSDGRVANFTGEAVAFESDYETSLKISDIKFTLPEPLPEGYEFTKIEVDPLINLRAKAEAGDAVAQNEIGNAYYLGDGVTKDHSESVRWWLKAAEQGNWQAQHHLGFAYMSGEGVRKNLIQAARWYALAKQARFLKPIKIDMESPDPTAILREQAEAGDMIAQFQLGDAYCFGKGVKKNLKESTRWLKLAYAQSCIKEKKAFDKKRKK